MKRRSGHHLPLLAVCAVFVSVLMAANAGLAYAATTWVVSAKSGGAGQAQSQVLAAPGSVTATCKTSSGFVVTVTWTAAVHATSYTILESTTSATSGYTVASSGVTALTWSSANLATGSYYFEAETVIGSAWVSAASPGTAQRRIKTTPPGAGCT